MIGSMGSEPVILILQESDNKKQIAVSALEFLGYRAQTAVNASEAVQFSQEKSIVAILVDSELSEIDAYEATKEIRRSEGIGKSIPIIAIASQDDHACDEKCRAAGINDYMYKPFSVEKLSRILKQWLKNPADLNLP